MTALHVNAFTGKGDITRIETQIENNVLEETPRAVNGLSSTSSEWRDTVTGKVV
jgi:hypothetical protein